MTGININTDMEKALKQGNLRKILAKYDKEMGNKGDSCVSNKENLEQIPACYLIDALSELADTAYENKEVSNQAAQVVHLAWLVMQHITTNEGSDYGGFAVQTANN